MIGIWNGGGWDGLLSTSYLKLPLLWKWTGPSLSGRSAGRAAGELGQAEADSVYSLGFNHSYRLKTLTSVFSALTFPSRFIPELYNFRLLFQYVLQIQRVQNWTCLNAKPALPPVSTILINDTIVQPSMQHPWFLLPPVLPDTSSECLKSALSCLSLELLSSLRSTISSPGLMRCFN